MKLVKYLAQLGYGSRREVMALLESGQVSLSDGREITAGAAFEHAQLRVRGEPLDVAPGSVLMLHKPVGYVCSTRDAGRLIYDLLTPRFRARRPLLAPVGRLDRDTSGLLLLTDDGQLNHRITSPRRHCPKVYEAQLAEDLRGDEAALFESGRLMLEGEDQPLAPAGLEVLAPRRARLTVTEGRYHQVRRMFAAVGNHVLQLHRSAIGGIELGELAPGSWRPLTEAEREKL